MLKRINPYPVCIWSRLLDPLYNNPPYAKKTGSNNRTVFFGLPQFRLKKPTHPVRKRVLLAWRKLYTKGRGDNRENAVHRNHNENANETPHQMALPRLTSLRIISLKNKHSDTISEEKKCERK